MAQACGLWREKASMLKDLSFNEKRVYRSSDTWPSCHKPGTVTQNHKDQGELARRVSLLL